MTIEAASQGTSAGGTILTLVVLAVLVALYFLPTVVAFRRRVPNVVQVALVNFFFGWSVIGWIIALIMAVRPAATAPFEQPK